MLRTAAIVGGCNGIGYALTAAFETHKLTDLVGVGSFVMATADMITKLPKDNLRAVLVDANIMLWGVRLASYLFFRVLKVGHDKRLDTFFRSPGEGFLDPSKSMFPLKLLSFWVIQAIWGTVCLIPVTYLNNQPTVEIDPLSAISIGVGYAATLTETIADWQKFSFRNDPANKGRWCDVGLWSLSRHPNYFAEILLWFSVYTSSFPALNNNQRLWSLFSPSIVYLLIMHLSGMRSFVFLHVERSHI